VRSSTASSVRSSTASSVASSVRSSTASSVASSVSSTAANKCTYVISNQWGGGFIGSVSIKNNRTTAINGWTVSWTYSDGSKVSNAWNATLAGSNPYTATAMSYNSTIQPGQTAEFGFQGTLPAGVTATAVAVTGAACN
jgi:Cellulose binding domain